MSQKIPGSIRHAVHVHHSPLIYHHSGEINRPIQKLRQI
jgi:hypothetical protein